MAVWQDMNDIRRENAEVWAQKNRPSEAQRTIDFNKAELAQSDAARAERNKANAQADAQTKVQGTFAQNADLKRGMQADQINAENWRNLNTEQGALTRSNLQYGPDSILASRTNAEYGPGGLQSRQLDIAQANADSEGTLRRAQADAAGIKVVPNSMGGAPYVFKNGQPVQQQNGTQGQDYSWIGKLDAKDPDTYKWLDSKSPEELQQFLNEAPKYGKPGMAILKGLRDYRSSLNANGGQSPLAVPQQSGPTGFAKNMIDASPIGEPFNLTRSLFSNDQSNDQ